MEQALINDKKNFPLTQRGFTLIELVIAVIIVGILAITAIPKYLALGTNARVAAVQGVAASVSGVTNSSAAQCAATPGCFGTGVTWLLTIGTGHYQMWNGYPDAGDTLNNNEIDTLVTVSSQFNVSITGPNLTIWQYATAPNPATCAVQYQEATSITDPPVITTTTTGC